MAPLLHERLARARRALVAAGVDDGEAAADAEVLARHVLGWDRAQLLTHGGDPLPSSFDPAFENLLARRVAREPMAYITGRREFWGRNFDVTPAVLIPRPETEIIIEVAIEESRRGRRFSTIVDVGTGSGCLAVTLALEFPDASVVATDISADALQVAQKNAALHDVEPRIRFIECNLLDRVEGRADLIVANPPYVSSTDEGHLQPEVERYEPHAALFAGPDGLDVIARLLSTAPDHLAAEGLLVIEFGFGQEAAVSNRAEAAGWDTMRIVPDLQGIARTAVLRR
jgi:release factor glutamine methyltransferase